MLFLAAVSVFCPVGPSPCPPAALNMSQNTDSALGDAWLLFLVRAKRPFAALPLFLHGAASPWVLGAAFLCARASAQQWARLACSSASSLGSYSAAQLCPPDTGHVQRGLLDRVPSSQRAVEVFWVRVELCQGFWFCRGSIQCHQLRLTLVLPHRMGSFGPRSNKTCCRRHLDVMSWLYEHLAPRPAPILCCWLMRKE